MRLGTAGCSNAAELRSCIICCWQQLVLSGRGAGGGRRTLLVWNTQASEAGRSCCGRRGAPAARGRGCRGCQGRPPPRSCNLLHWALRP